MFILKSRMLVAALLSAAAIFSHSEDAAAGESHYLTFGAGAYEIMDDDTSAEYRIEYEGKYLWRNLFPTFGVNGNSDGALYGFAGFGYDFYLGSTLSSDAFRGIYVQPTMAVGLYEEGNSKDLGGVVEFRSNLELGYQFENKYRLGLSISHISNAGIYDKNPGQESLTLNFSVPFEM